MKNLFKIALVIALIISLNEVYAQQPQINVDKVTKESGYENLYSSGDFYFGEQPNYQMLTFLIENDVKNIINLRSEDENKEFTKQAFSEEEMCKQLNINYIAIPMKGKEAFTPKNLELYIKALESLEGKTFVHCKIGGRATLITMAYLIKNKGISEEKAEKFGSQIRYFNYIDALLGE